MTIEELYRLSDQQLKERKPFILYRHPKEKEVYIKFQNNDQCYTISEYTKSGFVFAPFDNRKESLIIPDQQSTHLKVLATDFVEVETHNQVFSTDQFESNASERHVELVSNTVDYIKNGQSEKIVISRVETIPISKNGYSLFSKLINTYPNAFVYYWYHPMSGAWLGATPETLLQLEKNELKTMSLAGTQLDQGQSVDISEWGAKEIHEQAVVTKAIESALKPYVENLKLTGPVTHKAGSLLHLKTDVSGELKDPTYLNAIIKSLHPTPAVCGLPKEIAKQYILENEGYDRLYYTGFLGELNTDQKETSARLYVNLRCLELQDTSLKIYVGGGITADSNAKSEWLETVRKTQTMKKVLG